MEFILLVYRIKCWYNSPLQVLTNAPALHSLIIRHRKDVTDILKCLNHIHCDLRQLILEHCWLGEDSTGLLANIVTLYPDLEVLAQDGCHPLTPTGYCLIPRLKKLSDLKFKDFQVDYMCAKLLETHVCICEHM
jgi:hypothetical protein